VRGSDWLERSRTGGGDTAVRVLRCSRHRLSGPLGALGTVLSGTGAVLRDGDRGVTPRSGHLVTPRPSATAAHGWSHHRKHPRVDVLPLLESTARLRVHRPGAP